MANIKGKPFSDVLGEIQGGDLLQELTEQVYNIVAAAQQTRKAGSLTLKLKLTPQGRSMIVSADVAVKLPEDDRPPTTFFVAPDGALRRDDPNQARLPLREVEDRPRDFVSVEK